MYNTISNANWPGKQGMCIITRCITGDKDMMDFANAVSERTGEGYTIQSCGVNGSATEVLLAWAILTAKVVGGSA